MPNKEQEICRNVLNIFKKISPEQLRELRHMLNLKKQGYQISLGTGEEAIIDFLESDFEFELIETLVSGFEKKK